MLRTIRSSTPVMPLVTALVNNLPSKANHPIQSIISQDMKYD